MIDYEKLKECHELAKKLHNYTVYTRFSFPYMTYTLSHNDLRSDFNNLDGLLQKLRELATPESRYKVGDTWWYLDGESQYLVPRSVLIGKKNKDCYRSDDEWYPSKADLIQAQIDYWTNLKYIPEFEGEIKGFGEDTDYHAPKADIQSNQDQVDIDRCQHEPSNYILTSNPPKHHCIKCGEFYR